MMISNQNILISGAGIAGLTLAYWLRRYGFQPTIIEKRPHLGDEGYMIDFYGSGFDVAEEMGLLDALHEQHYPIQTLRFVNRQGQTRSTLYIDKIRQQLQNRHFNFMRGDLAAVLYDAVGDTVPIRFETSIREIRPGDEGVAVDLSDGTTLSADLLIGADGIHSNVRRHLWGPEAGFENFLGYYVACGIVDNFLGQGDNFYSYMEPGRQAAVYPIRGNRLATLFAFRAEHRNIREREQQATMLAHNYADMGWLVPELLARTTQSPHFYFDAVSQIKLSSWHQGRVALVGDGCHCLTLLAGQGASMAMAGAYLLARELQRAAGDYKVAFPAYQANLQPEIERRQLEAQKLAGSFVPDNRFSLWMMNLFLKVAFWPGFRQIFIRQIGARSVIK